jgi:Tfp pilus assembly protein PilO
MFYRLSSIIFSCVFLLNILFYLFVVLPLQNQSREEKKKIKTLRKSLMDTKEKRMNYQTTLQELSNFQEKIPLLDDMPKILSSISKISTNNGLDIPSVDYRPVRVEDIGLLRLSFTLSLEGSYKQLRTFIYELEKTPYLWSITDINLNRVKKEESEVKLQIGISIYFREK